MFKKNLFRLTTLSVVVAMCFFSACQSDGGSGGSAAAGGGASEGSESARAGDPQVILWERSDPDKLNPLTYQGAGAGYVLSKVSYSLMSIDFKSLELVPVLAKANPTIEDRTDGKEGMLITYEIRPEAKWDNGEPILAKDISFTAKFLLAPSTAIDNARTRPYYEFIEDIIEYPDNPRKLTFVCKEKYIRAMSATAMGPLPQYIYDPKKTMDKFTVKEFSANANKYANDPDLVALGKEISSPKFDREVLVGCGPYEFVGWETNKRITLKKKKNWWGDQLAGTNGHFNINAPETIHEVIKDMSTAVTALKGEKLDVMRGIDPKAFIDLQKSDKFNQNFKRHTPVEYSYAYLGLNTRIPKFQSKKVRQALAHLVDVETIIDNVQYGLGERVNSPIHPSKKSYNRDIKPYPYDIEKAKKMLEEEGWKDTNGNGVIDKVIEGEKIEMEIDYTFNSTNEQRKATGLIFQESARQAGIKVNVIPQEWAVYLENQKNHKFEMFYGAWISAPLPDDHKQIWHTESYNGGSNYVGFGNAETDELIEQIRRELDDGKRAELNKKLQAIMHDETAYIFLFCPKGRIAIHSRYDNAEASSMRPGYWEPSFSVAKK